MNSQMDNVLLYMIKVIRNYLAIHVMTESSLENGTFPAICLEKVSYAYTILKLQLLSKSFSCRFKIVLHIHF